jgi:hypothetical protein
VLHARGSELESAFCFGVVRQLFEPAISRASSEGEATLFEGAAGHAGRLFRDDLENAQANEDVAFSLLHGLYWLTLNLAESQPLVIAIDDMQWADAPSLLWLSYLARRIEGECHLRYSHSAPHRARESRARGAAGRFCNDPSATERAELSGGCRAGSGGAGAEADDAFCEACYQATGGNPLLLRELVRALVAEDVVPVASSVAIVQRVAPDAVARSVMLRLSRLPHRPDGWHGQWRSSVTARLAIT